jgi:hypothetical protein
MYSGVVPRALSRYQLAAQISQSRPGQHHPLQLNEPKVIVGDAAENEGVKVLQGSQYL